MRKKDQRLVNGFISGDLNVLERCYQDHLPYVIRFIIKNGGSEEEAKDVFQDAMVITHKKLRERDFELTSTLGTYLIGVSKKIWSNRQRKLTREVKMEVTSDLEHPDDDVLEKWDEEERVNLFQKHFLRLSQDCQDLLRLFFEKKSMKQIAEMRNTTEGYVKKRKFKCKSSLLKMVTEDPLFNELKHHEKDGL
ncbi:MAG: sigma-70 family RNA polymerase sigma factor [Bacteroidota bacterium]